MSSVSPAVGSPLGGTAVTIAGSNFAAASAVYFGTLAGTNLDVVSPSEITVTSPAGSLGTLDVVVATPVGTSAVVAADQFSYENAPSVSSLSPPAGLVSGGSLVTVTGSGFVGTSAVEFGTNPADYTVLSASEITTTTPAGTAGSVDVTVITPMGESATSVADQFTYESVPQVSSLSPLAGPLTGGKSVTITGSGFADATGVSFGSSPASAFSVVSATEITTTSPSGAAGAVEVSVTTPVGTSASSAADLFSYEAAPTVNGLSPAAGLPGGGSDVTITGSGFTGTSAVYFGTTTASSYSVISASEMTAVSPSGAVGAVDITVTTPVATSATSSVDLFTYESAPVIGAISPSAGATSGGSRVTITGTGFSSASAVSFASTPASEFEVVSPTEITATSPAQAGSIVDITVTTPSGTSATSSADEFTYETVAVVSAISPASGPLGGGTSVTITGSGFAGADAVSFGSIAASSYTVDSLYEITASAPSAGAGVVDITVSTPSGTSATGPADQFTYEAPPAVSSVSPGGGSLAGGSTVIISGSSFTGATALDFGTVSAAGFVVDSSTVITATSPAEAAGIVDLTVTTPSGTSATSSADHFTYEVSPTVTSVSPGVGPLGGGTPVTIAGTAFTAATTVRFGSVSAAFSVVSATEITATAPFEAAGTLDVTVTTPTGSSATSASDHFTYESSPTIISLSPIASAPTGGASVIITGTDFSGASHVLFGSVAATSFTVNSATKITVSAPAQSAGTVDVAVVTPVGTSATSPSDEFTYEAAPVVSSLSPAAGLPEGGTSVTVTGTGFVGASAVSFGATAAVLFVVESSTKIVATSPAEPAGVTDVTVTTPAGTSATGAGDSYVFEGVPSVVSISPSAGSPSGGTSVTITGSDFSDVSAVSFGSVSASYAVSSDSTIIATAPASSAGTVDVRVTTAAGESAASAADQFSYETAPAVTAVSGRVGSSAGGATVTITGSGFADASAVNFGSVPAPNYIVISASTITATTPASPAGAIDVTVTTPAGTSSTSGADLYTYEGIPVVSTLSPAAGSSAGSAVTITGSGFSGALLVTFGTTTAASFNVVSASEITTTAPAHAAGTVEVTVSNAVATSASTAFDQFTYEAAPTVSSISPADGLPAGGTSVTITGSAFSDASAVNFGAIGAGVFTVVSASEIVAVTPAEAAGVVEVTVTTPAGASATASADQFNYQGTPAVSSVSPDGSLPAGGATATITGTGFSSPCTVHFGTVASSSCQVVSGSQILAPIPAGSGTVDVTVATVAGSSATTPADELSYEVAPVVSSVTPSSGPLAGGTSVVVLGSDFAAASAVSFGSAVAESYTIDSAGEITALSPAGVSGTVDLTVTTPVATSATSSADHFAYSGLPTVTAVSPAGGAPSGGTSVTITGTNFLGATDVYFGASAATGFNVVSSTDMTAVSPAGSAGSVDVTVATSGGTSAINTADKFVFGLAPVVGSVSPQAGLPAGGDSVAVTGSNFTGATSVHFGTLAATSYSVVSSSGINVSAPAQGAGTVDITVTNPNGTSPTTLVDEFTYEPAPSVASVSPLAGPLGGHSAVTITGTGFADTTGVSFGSVGAASFTVVSATEITATSPPESADAVNVTVTTPVATSATGTADLFSFQAAPAVSSLSPAGGLTSGGTSVTITGTGFVAASAVHFGTVTAGYDVVSSTEITTTAPAGTGSVDVTVTTPSGTSGTSVADEFTYEPAPSVTSLSPGLGFTGGRTAVTLTGTGFADSTAVAFGSVAAISYVVMSPTEIIAVAPAQSVGSVDITVTNPVGTSATGASDLYYYEGAPVITSLSPAAGLVSGSTTVTITGSSLEGVTGVSFGQTAATSFDVLSPTEITTVSPASAAGVVALSVTTSVGTSAASTSDQFSYEAAPVVSSVSPAAGLASGGTVVSISGTSFGAASAVDFASVGASDFVINSATSITALSPASSPGTVDVTVTTPAGSSTPSSSDHFTYAPVPAVSSVSPATGLPAGGATVVISGSGLSAASAVDFGSAPASFVVDSDTQITAMSPAASVGTVNVTVSTALGTSASSAADQFTYEAAPVVLGVSPAAGLPAGGGVVEVSGTGFAGASAVSFGSIAASSFTVLSPSEISAVVPAQSAGTVDITLTTPSGTSATVAADRFVYEPAPTVDAVSPATGPATGGTTVTITGSDFAVASAVNFASTPATSFAIVSPTEITAVSPAQSPSVVDVTVTTPSGTSAMATADQFTYGARISGMVTDGNNPLGLSGVCVSVTAPGASGQAVTAADGTYSISGLPSGTYTVEFDPTCSGTVSSSDLVQWYTDAPTAADSTPVSVTGSQNMSGVDATLYSNIGALPGAPAGVTAMWADGSATVTWSDPENNGSAIKIYTVTAIDATNPANGGQSCAALGAKATSCTVSGLVNGDSYSFVVTATNAVGTGPASAPSNSVMPITVPGAPTAVTAVHSLVSPSATVSWTAPASDGGSSVVSYLVKASGNGGQACSTLGATSCVVNGLVTGASYSFFVVATNIVGPGPASAASDQVKIGRWSEVALTLSSPYGVYGHEQLVRVSVLVYARFVKHAAVPTGTVTISELAKTLCSFKLKAGAGSCDLPASALAKGSYHLVATYSGNLSYLGSSRAKKFIVGGPAATFTTLHLSHTTASFGHESVTNMTVITKTHRAGTPTGKVTVSAGGKVVCTIVLRNDIGSCRLGASELPVGTYTLTATYPGGSLFLASRATAKLTVVH